MADSGNWTLTGDDLSLEGIADWYHDEEEGFYELFGSTEREGAYPYHITNQRYGYSHLPPRRFVWTLGFGAGHGDELEPVASRLERVTIVDSSTSYGVSSCLPENTERIKADPSGDLPFRDATFDLVTCLGVLHHIPNVTHVFGELTRVLARGGFLILREPTHSMGDWRVPRPGLTARERGIPLPFLESLVRSAGLGVVSRRRFLFAGTPRLSRALRLGGTLADPRTVALDERLSELFSWRYVYEMRLPWDKLQPLCVFYVLKKGP